MAKIFMLRILAGIMTIDDVPHYWKKKTQKLLDDYYKEHPEEKDTE